MKSWAVGSAIAIGILALPQLTSGLGLPYGPAGHELVKVGVVGPYSGPATTNGLGLLAGAELAARDAAGESGTGQPRLEIVALDESDPSTARDLAADPDIVAVVGYIGTLGGATLNTFTNAGLVWLAAEPVEPQPGASTSSASSLPLYYLVARPAVYLTAVRSIAASRRDGSDSAGGAISERCDATLRLDGGIIRDGSDKFMCGIPLATIAGELTKQTPGVHFVCLIGCDASEVWSWATGADLTYLTPGPGPRADVSLAARIRSSSGVSGNAARYAAIGYDGVETVRRAVDSVAKSGQVDRASTAAAIERSDWLGTRGHYSQAGLDGGTVEIWRGYPGTLTSTVSDPN